MSQLSGMAVIGANYGDEGKGLVTDALVGLRQSSTVVRFNGGAQAGHTVVTPEKIRHVFSHIGSGGLLGADTYLSRYFVCHPKIFNGEIEALRAKMGGQGMGVVFVHKDALVTTPWDEIVNQFLELGRGKDRHGSVGIGFGETIERSETPDYLLRVADLFDSTTFGKRLSAIMHGWFPARLKELHQKGEFKELDGDQLRILKSYVRDPSQITEAFIRQCMKFLSSTTMTNSIVVRDPSKPVIFEGAQGLMLDPTFGEFPHVTRSSTGLVNVKKLCKEEGIELINTVYVTRHYATRHGRGPLPHEGAWRGTVDDSTNVYNPYQEMLRTGGLDWDAMLHRIATDSTRDGVASEISLAITHMDNLVFPYTMFWGQSQRSVISDRVTFELETNFGWMDRYFAAGPTRETFTWS